ncbi:MAG: GIY-YIG nuclease family protein [Candidatus Omnitrophica bacterium]|nr:GIY-YIG nuclease family protein [Candidatus Omnitrophota bacterium]
MTTHLSRRYQDHLYGRGGDYTGGNKPKELVYSEELLDSAEARKREKQIKGWSRAKKLALIQKNLEVLRVLSKSRN